MNDTNNFNSVRAEGYIGGYDYVEDNYKTRDSAIIMFNITIFSIICRIFRWNRRT